MPSAFILSERSYPALPLARQLVHQRFVRPGPLVLGTDPLKPPAPTTDRDRPVSRRSKPSSRTAFIGEQPNPWELGLPRLRVGQDYTTTMTPPVTRRALGAGRVIRDSDPLSHRVPLPGLESVVTGARFPGSLPHGSDAGGWTGR